MDPMRDAFELVKARDKQLQRLKELTNLLHEAIKPSIQNAPLNKDDVAHLTLINKALDTHSTRISQFFTSLDELEKAGSKEYVERFSFYLTASSDASREGLIIETAVIFLALGYRIGCRIGSNPVLERLAKERAKAQTQKGRATRLKNERPEIDKRRKIVLECAESYFRSNPATVVTMHDLATQIRPDVDKKCKSSGIKARKSGTIVTDLQSVSTIAETLAKRRTVS